LSVFGTRSGDVYVGGVVAHDLRESNETLLECVGAGDRNVANVLRCQRRALGGVLGVDLVRGRRDFDFLVDLVRVIQPEGDFVDARVQGEGLAGENEVAFFANLGLIVTGRKIAQRVASGAIGLRGVGFSANLLQRDVRGRDWNIVLVEHYAGTIRRFGCAKRDRHKQAESYSKGSNETR
jgi:hypothetical protein